MKEQSRTINPICPTVRSGEVFVIATYDINRKRVAKVMKVCRKYLRHIQRSVFEGVITDKMFRMLQGEIDDIIHDHEDHVVFYTLRSEKYVEKIEAGESDLPLASLLM